MGQTQTSNFNNTDSPVAESSPTNYSADIRMGKELLQATEPFAAESVAKSWWYVGSTFSLMILALVGAGIAPWWPLRLLLSLLGALLMVRAFITYHDYMHGAILRRSRLAWLLFHIYAAFALTPPRSWSKSHNYHHGHVGKISAASVGAFPVITTRMWREATSKPPANHSSAIRLPCANSASAESQCRIGSRSSDNKQILTAKIVI